MTNPLKELYARLKERGFDRKFLERSILPSWWHDSLAEIPANRALVEMEISRHLKFDLSAIRNTSVPLPPLVVEHVRFKKRKDTSAELVCPSLLVAQRVASVVVDAIDELPEFNVEQDAASIRRDILSSGKLVNLQSLLHFAWDNGIVVVHVSSLPRAPKFDGIAMFVGQRPVVVLASQKQGAPWIAFHLAHELGHIFRRHVYSGADAIVDSEIAGVAEDDVQESEANGFGLELLTGTVKGPQAPSKGMNLKELLQSCTSASKELLIDAGTLALIYGYQHRNRMGVAQLALRHLGQSNGAHSEIWKMLLNKLDLDSVPESCQRLVQTIALNPDLISVE